MNEIPKQQKWKGCPRAHSMHVLEDGNNLVQTRLGGEVWATDVIMQKAYFMTVKPVHAFTSLTD